MNIAQLSSLKESIELLQYEAIQIKNQLDIDLGDACGDAESHLVDAYDDAKSLVKELGRSLDTCTTIQAAYNSALSEA